MSSVHTSPDRGETDSSVCAVDLFCGAGGLTRGLEDAGIDVTLGVDIDSVCRYPYTYNNGATFLEKSIEEVAVDDFPSAFHRASYRLVAGCAPCQPFSTYSRSRSGNPSVRWNLLDHFGRLVREVKPHLVTMENVPMLQREQVFSDFVDALEDEGFDVATTIVDCADYGVPQRRRRLVVLASILGPIDLIPPTTPAALRPTVRDAIADMPAIDAGGESGTDALHRSSRLSPLNVRRIRASKPGGTWRDWDEALIAECHRKPEGRTYPSVYGRMEWDHPSPTMTTQYYGFGNGRFGHPEQDRAISLREGAILQSFAEGYRFVEPGEPISTKTIGRLVGNAVPVNLGHAIGSSLVRHVEDHLRSRGSPA
ncbi:MAG: DNA cytosine methyltransferase [Gemmatimonadetes bacterium]|nr:DNA cytosine methyltransferase [Candidatus Palauibacter rhopaloidicola]